MKEWVFIDIPPGVVDGFAGSDFPFPIRKDRMADFEKLREEMLSVPVLMDELEEYLDENPARVERYRDAGAYLAMCAAVDACIDNCREHALDYFRLSLWFDETNPAVRMSYAVALHSLERRAEAIEQYEAIMASEDINAWWRAWMLKGEALLALGRNEEALETLREAERALPDDNQFWDTLAVAEERANPVCGQCGAKPQAGARFCGQCGGALGPA